MAQNIAFAPTRHQRPGFTSAFFAAFTGVFQTWKQRQTLSRLSADALKDIGRTKSEAQREARRPIWDVPNHWRG